MPHPIENPLSRRDMARLANVSTVTLKTWEVAGLIPTARRVTGKLVEYRPADALVVLALAEARGHGA